MRKRAVTWLQYRNPSEWCCMLQTLYFANARSCLVNRKMWLSFHKKYVSVQSANSKTTTLSTILHITQNNLSACFLRSLGKANHDQIKINPTWRNYEQIQTKLQIVENWMVFQPCEACHTHVYLTTIKLLMFVNSEIKLLLNKVAQTQKTMLFSLHIMYEYNLS